MKVVIWDLWFMEYKKGSLTVMFKNYRKHLKIFRFFLFISRKSQPSVVLPRGSWKRFFSNLSSASLLLEATTVGEHDFWCIAGEKMDARCFPTGLRSINERSCPDFKKELQYISTAATSCISIHRLASGFEAMGL